MRLILQLISLAALIALILPSVLFLAGSIELEATKWTMLLATVVWFVTATPWMWKDDGQTQQDYD
jgi:branched-subunit amino acid transport protein